MLTDVAITPATAPDTRSSRGRITVAISAHTHRTARLYSVFGHWSGWNKRADGGCLLPCHEGIQLAANWSTA